eukprot:CFRG6851T1
MQAVQRQQSMHRINLIEPSFTTPSHEYMNELKAYVQYSLAAYGCIGLYIMGQVPQHSKIRTDCDAISLLTGVCESDVMLINKSEVYRPGHFVCVDKARKVVVVSIRGTSTLQDVCTFLTCTDASFSSIYDRGVVTVNGRAHSGLLNATINIANELQTLVDRLLNENLGYKLVITGHSLGAGVATLLTLEWAKVPLFRQRSIHAYTFGTPQVLCSTIAQAPFTKRHVSTVIVGDDFAPRIGLGSFVELHLAIIHLAPAVLTSLSCEEKVCLLNEIPTELMYSKLSCAGSVWLIDSDACPDKRVIRIDPQERFTSLLLSIKSIFVHSVVEYKRAVLDTYDRMQEGRNDGNLRHYAET